MTIIYLNVITVQGLFHNWEFRLNPHWHCIRVKHALRKLL